MKDKGQMMFVMSKLTLLILLIGLMAITLATYNFFQASTMRSYANALVSRVTTVSESIAKSGSSQDLQIFTLPYTIGSSTNRVVYGLKITTVTDNDSSATYAIICLYSEKNLKDNNDNTGAIACNSFALDNGKINLFKYPDYTKNLETVTNAETITIIPRNGEDKLIIQKITTCNDDGDCTPKMCIAPCSSTSKVGPNPIDTCKTKLKEVCDLE